MPLLEDRMATSTLAAPKPPPPTASDPLRDPTLSSYREQLVEYLFLTELLQDGWLRRRQQIDVLRADVDGAGYDLVADCQGVLRHVQLKSSVEGGRASRQSIHIALASQPAGCVVWVILGQGDGHRLALSYLAYGDPRALPLTGLERFPNARHAKANAQGHKSHRPRIRSVPRTVFTPLQNIQELSDWLFGAPGSPPSRIR